MQGFKAYRYWCFLGALNALATSARTRDKFAFEVVVSLRKFSELRNGILPAVLANDVIVLPMAITTLHHQTPQNNYIHQCQNHQLKMVELGVCGAIQLVAKVVLFL